MRWDRRWEFNTARFTVAFEVMPEEDDPDDHFDRPEDIESVWNGSTTWFVASVAVYLDGREVARDTLGGCAYNSVQEFYTSHRDRDPMNRNCTIMRQARGGSPDAEYSICHYFPGMVSEAIAQARAALENAPKLRHA